MTDAPLVLYHNWLHGPSRMVRVLLMECTLDFSMRIVKPWEYDQELLSLNPSGAIPVLRTQNGFAICNSATIAEYVHETCEASFMGSSAMIRAETRRLCQWFHEKLCFDVIDPIVDEKIHKRFLKCGQPDSARLRAAQRALPFHMQYIGWILKQRDWLACNAPTLADTAAAAALSCLDYLGDVPWEAYPEVKEWYVKVKSRPSFRTLLDDHIPGMPPPNHYAHLDF